MKKVIFDNKKGDQLVGRIELPPDQKPHNFAIFAHCFTCTKNLSAVRNISRSLNQMGFGVLRFDFTGLGESKGDFSDTDFSGNVEDLVAAADYLTNNYAAPTLLVGHSLGGAAVIFAAEKISSIKALATIAAPCEPSHVKRLFKEDLEEIKSEGKAEVLLEGRPFTIKKKFVDDLLNHSLKKILQKLRKSILILHSPQDRLVDITNAEYLYKNAFHPKSFVSLDGADHLLSKKKDSLYVGKVIAEWASRYLDISEAETISSKSNVAASLNQQDTFTTTMKLGSHPFLADEPETQGGKDFGPSPYEYLSGALAACKAMTVQLYARRKEWEVDNITVHIDHVKKHAEDCENCEDKNAKIDTFTCKISLEGKLNSEQRKQLLQISERCPVHKTLSSDIQIFSELKN